MIKGNRRETIAFQLAIKFCCISKGTEVSVIALADACLSAVYPSAADAEFGADLRLYHAVHVTVQNGKF